MSESVEAKQTSNEESSESISESYQRAVSLIESSPQEAVKLLKTLQHRVAQAALFSANETLEDVSTGSLPLLGLEHSLAIAYLQIPPGPDAMVERQSNLQMACDLWESFLQRLDRLDMLSAQEQEDLNHLIELMSAQDDTNPRAPPQPKTASRDSKIARFKAKQAAEQERAKLESYKSRRNRLGISETETMDGFDRETLERTIALKTLEISRAEAIDEWSSALRELPMIQMMAKAQEDRQKRDRYQGKTSPVAREEPTKSGLKLTHITKNAAGQLQVREEIREQVFRPGWNQPTMTLEELAEREVAEAKQRDERQKQAEAANKNAPQRYDQLVKDGQEDNVDLVDASAALDRQWDDWKDENPRGSGNKRGDVGDRNF